jgi:hypothetical protein
VDFLQRGEILGSNFFINETPAAWADAASREYPSGAARTVDAG